VAQFIFEETIYTGVLDGPASVARLDVAQGSSGPELVLVDNAAGHWVEFDLSTGNTATVTTTVIYPPSLGSTQTVIVDGRGVTLGNDDLGAVDTSAEADSLALYANRSGQAEDRIEALSVDVGGQTYVYLAATDGEGMNVFRLQSNGNLTAVSEVQDTSDTFAAGITSMTQVTVGATTYVIAASAKEDGLTSYAAQPDGSLQPVYALGADDLLPINDPQALETVSMGGQEYVILASSGSSSLTVLEVGADGSLTPVDQVMDDLNTRFANVSVLETFTVDDHVYVLAAGGDDGFSVFQLLPDGRLLHMETLVDTPQASLTNITDIAVRIVGGEVQLFVASGSEAGISQFTLVPSSLGIVLESNAANINGTASDDILYGGDGDNTLSGQNGDDILIDGAGADQMTGGNGSDIFVLSPDGETDVIMDFQLGQDRLDLSAYGMVYSTDDLTVISTSDGAILEIEGEQLIIHTANGLSLDKLDFTPFNLINVSRVKVGQATPIDPDMIEGTSEDDHLIAGDGDQSLFGREGDDMLCGGMGADLLDGGSGSDTADYSAAAEGVVVNLGNSALNTGEAAGDTFTSIENILGSSSADHLTGNGAANTLTGGNGSDVLHGMGGADTLMGGGGSDTLRGGAGGDVLDGGGGTDFADYAGASIGLTVDLATPSANTGESAGDSYNSIEGIIGTDFDDTLSGNANDNIIYGGNGTDRIYGQDGDDTIYGEGGVGILISGNGNDTVYGGSSLDFVIAGAGDDTADGGDFIDFLFTQGGNDTLLGGGGDDRLNAGGGSDRLIGGTGNDSLTGGTGADVFVFETFTTNEVDTIKDFEDGIDKIEMQGVSGGYGALTISETTISGKSFVEIDYDGQTIRLESTSLADISASDFIFV